MRRNRVRNLVTGGAGFLGSHLCEALLMQGEEVICLDNLFTGSKDNLLDLMNLPRFEFIRWDVTDPIHIECDRIWNLACPASPVHYQRNPVETVRTCVMGAINMLELARRNNARILQTSTSEVYGDPEVHPQHERYVGAVNPIGPRACYDEGKRVAETLFFDYHRQHAVDIRVARIFNTYGPHMHPNDGRVVSNFIMAALSHKPIVMYGDGLQTRSFCYVDDMVYGLIKLMDSDFNHMPINLGNPGEFNLLELAKLVFDAVDVPQHQRVIQHIAPTQDDPRQRRPDINIAKQWLLWEPKVKLVAGLAKTTEYFRNV